MSHRFLRAARRLLLFFLLFPLAAFAEFTSTNSATTDATIPPTDTTDGNIAQVTAEMLQSWHYSRQPFDADMSSKMLDRYLDMLDYSHLYFQQSDISEFDRYRTNLNSMIMRREDLGPCWTIFSRFMTRASERINFVTNYLDSTKMDFSGHERFTLDRHLLPYPKDEDERHEFWRQAARCEYLDEMLKSPDVKYEGKVAYEPSGQGKVSLTRDKAHPLTLDFLPDKFFDKAGHEIAALELTDNRSNAVARLEWSIDKEKRATNTVYSAKGDELGTISTHFVATLRTNVADAASTNRVYDTNLSAAIQLNEKNLAEVLKNLTNHYVQMFKNYKELDNDRVFELYMTALTHAYDPHSDYFGHLEAENFAIQMKLSLSGIGALLGTEDGYCKISELKDGPAMRSGKIKPNDRIVEVKQSNAEPVNVVGMPLDKVVQMIRGPKGTKVTLTLIPAEAVDSSERKLVTLVRDEIKLEESAAKARIYETKDAAGQTQKLGLIDLNAFYANPEAATDAGGSTTTSIDVARLIKRLKKEHVDGIVLDLRRNGGGYLEEAIKLTGLFIPKGPVVQTKDFNGDTMTDSCQDSTVLWDGPLIVLTSRFSASASEILAGALQDYGRALIVGDRTTFGKGTVQTVQGLEPILDSQHMHYAFDPGELKVTIKKFYRAGGASTQLKGVVSDLELPSVWSYADVGESSLPNAMPWDEVSTAEFVNLNRVKPYLGDLQEKSRRRMEADPEFAFMRDRIERYKKEMADKSVSLNEKERAADQKQLVAANEALKKHRGEEKPGGEKTFEITLKNVDTAGLFPPTVKTNSAAASEDEFDIDDELTAHEDTGEVDPDLEETKHILSDYIALLNKGPIISKADSNLPTRQGDVSGTARTIPSGNN